MINLTNDYSIALPDDLKKCRNRIYRLGIELEGGWNKPPKKGVVERDGSVQLEVQPRYGQGELPSPPLAIEDYKQWVTENYPQVVNKTCGLHVHMSFKSALTYQRLMDPRYPATILTYVRKWGEKAGFDKTHPLWERLEGNSIYCQHKFSADEQIINNAKDYNKERRGHRYTVVNYCWNRTGTIECRLLPAMDTSELAIDAIETVINITNAFLVATAKKEAKVKGETLVNSKGINEIRNVRLR